MATCKYCCKTLPEDSRLNAEYCSEDHRTKFNNEKRKVASLHKKALRAIAELETIAAAYGPVHQDAKDKLVKLGTYITTEK